MQLGDDLHLATSRLEAAEESAEEYVSKLKHLEIVESRTEEFQKRYTDIQHLYALIDDFGLEVTEIDRAALLNLANESGCLISAAKNVNASKEGRIAGYMTELERGKSGLGKTVNRHTWFT